ncbi:MULTISPECIES: KCU-star family selenoprotein [unclassified Campylobacter]|uniref:KCU-star family selenoprotein n=1 Tax=unclassified Campylobacter TaxID=2593542 RepID=UPI0012381862|nr:YbdD/YjiX family protein [Campylobacter sp. LR185c]KAA6225727.1 YbdD/YjiX family protein [Campylobacter sp. LR286c]KAA6225848.1 YbdD/YjiX family protein [Campylobacter sp. LR196d]KAA6229700.1 YbdD/YjiX family protein [Campylobacter sp. LR291e]KAA6230054.1 YbdD/YjiX family protein [Campylobacter sp. LR264d]
MSNSTPLKIVSRIKHIYGKAERFFHPLVGLSSYDKYLEHMKKAHPDRKPQSRGEFFKERLEKRYNSGGVGKCC